MFFVRWHGGRELSFWTAVFALLTCGILSTPEVSAQGSANDLGNGGRHTIQGRIYVSSGRRSQVSGLKIRLTSTSAGDLTIVSDDSGTFIFRGVNAGSYLVTIDGGGFYEDVTESVVIDDPGSSSIRNTARLRASPRVVNVQIYLQAKRSAEGGQSPGVVNAKWADVPREAAENYERGIRLVQEGNDQGAESAFRRSIEAYPGFTPAHTELGRLNLKKGRLEECVALFRTALRYDPKDFDARLHLGIALLNKLDLDAAEKELVEAAFLNTHAVTPHYYLGVLFVEKKNYDIAQKAFEKAKRLKRDKDYPLLHRYLGGIYQAKRLRKEAVQELETYLRLQPEAKDADRIRRTIDELKVRQS